ncbi:hypothetical protein AB0H18_41905, partial [Streptomyces sp. NPDC020766]|uniref:hypothetical protein n=1 Tax=Streptomyces sp. NPDC020766 TaxID=3155011 RepID=UPI0033EA4B55
MNRDDPREHSASDRTGVAPVSRASEMACSAGLADQMAELLQGGPVVQLLDRLDAHLAQQSV